MCAVLRHIYWSLFRKPFSHCVQKFFTRCTYLTKNVFHDFVGSFWCLTNQMLLSLTICWRGLHNCVCVVLRSLSRVCCSFSPYEFWDILSKLAPVDERSNASVFSVCAFCAMAQSFKVLFYILKYTSTCFKEETCILQRIAALYRGLLKYSPCHFAHFSVFNVVVKQKNALFFTLLYFYYFLLDIKYFQIS